jgi:hypothetical protein
MSEVRNPYAAPEAAVADVAMPADAPPRPEHVRKACMLLWVSLAVSVIGVPFNFSAQAGVSGVSAGISFVALAISSAFSLGITALITWWFTAKLSAGRNWMRWLLNILIGGSFALLLLLLLGGLRETLWAMYYDQPVLGFLAMAQFGLSVGALVLINTATSREWFAAMKRRPR